MAGGTHIVSQFYVYMQYGQCLENYPYHACFIRLFANDRVQAVHISFPNLYVHCIYEAWPVPRKLSLSRLFYTLIRQ